MIEIRNLSKAFGKKAALDGVSCDIPDGCIFGMVGANGAGKSTLLRLIAGVYVPDAGTVTLDGEPVFDKLDAELGKALFSIGAVKGFEIGDGFAVAKACGSTNNDAFCMKDGQIVKKTNHAGGILGGISDGSPIILRAAIKPTPSIASTQQTVNRFGEEIDIHIKGRHDPIIVPRAVVVVEAMAAVTIADALLMNMTSRLDSVQNFYLP